MSSSTPQFGLADDAYRAFRPAYPDALFARILARVPDRRERAMDLGAGTGLSTLPLCRWFREVIAVEPDDKMAARLPRLDERIVVRLCAAEQCEQPPASLDLVTCGTAFYWMDGPRMLEKIAAWLRPGGVLAVYRGRFPGTPAAVQAILDREMRERWDAFRHHRLRDEAYSERTIRTSRAFASIEVSQLPNTILLDAAQLAGFMRSTSYASTCARTLPDPDAYWRSLEQELRLVAPAVIPVDFALELILAIRI